MDCKSYREDGGRSTKVGYQEQALNHLKRLLLRAMVVSVKEKSSKTRQVRYKETSRPEPLLKRR